MNVWSVIGGLTYPFLSCRGGSFIGSGVKSLYGIKLSKWLMQFNPAFFLSSAPTMHYMTMHLSKSFNDNIEAI